MPGRRSIPLERTFAALAARNDLRILVVKLRALGDVLLSTVVLPNLRNAFPDARIDFLTESPAHQLLEGRPELDGVISIHRHGGGILRTFRQVHRAHYHLVFDLFCNPRSAQITWATRADVRVGYPFRGRAWAYNVHATSRSSAVHNVEFNLDALRAIGIPITSTVLSMPVDPEAAAAIDAWLASSLPAGTGPLVAVNPSGTWDAKRWGLEQFAALGDLLAERHHARCILLWGPGEEADVAAIRGMMRHPAIIAPPTTLRQLAALTARCDAVISNDAGPMHVAAATGRPTLGIFGPTNPALQGPYNPLSRTVRNEAVPCLGCNLTTCPIGKVCMTGLSPETVLQHFEEMMHSRL